MSYDYALKMQRIYELKEALVFKTANQELYDLLLSTIVWLFRYCDRTGVHPPDVSARLKKITDTIDEIYPDHHPKGDTQTGHLDKGTV